MQVFRGEGYRFGLERANRVEAWHLKAEILIVGIVWHAGDLSKLQVVPILGSAQ